MSDEIQEYMVRICMINYNNYNFMWSTYELLTKKVYGLHMNEYIV